MKKSELNWKLLLGVLVVLCSINVFAEDGQFLTPLNESELEQLGFRSLGDKLRKQTEWEQSQFDEAQVTEQRIKSIDPMKGHGDLYPRFTIIREIYKNQTQAEKRVSRIADHDPVLNSKMQPELILRKGFRLNNEVWIVATDAVIFSQKELDSVLDEIRKLKNHVDNLGSENNKNQGYCAYPDIHTRQLEQINRCGSIKNGLLQLDPLVTEKVDWSKYGMQCLYISQGKINGWFYVNQNGLGRESPFGQDNDCTPFQSGLAVGVEGNHVVFFDQTMSIVKTTDYSWASGFYQGYSKVCKGKLKKVYDGYGELFEYQGGLSGFINMNFKAVIPIEYPFESTPTPREANPS